MRSKFNKVREENIKLKEGKLGLSDLKSLNLVSERERNKNVSQSAMINIHSPYESQYINERYNDIDENENMKDITILMKKILDD